MSAGPDASAAEEVQGGHLLRESGWRIQTGIERAEERVSLHYGAYSPVRTIDTDETSSNSRWNSSPYVTVAYTGMRSGLELTYSQAHAEATLVERNGEDKTVLFLTIPAGTPISLGVADLRMDAIKLRYTRSFGGSPAFDYGGALALQALFVSATTQIEDYGNKSYVVPLPSFGLYSAYRPTSLVTCRLQADYLPVVWKDIDGHTLDWALRAEYQLTSSLSAGIGCRYSVKEIHLRKPTYNARSQLTLGAAELFLGMNF